MRRKKMPGPDHEAAAKVPEPDGGEAKLPAIMPEEPSYAVDDRTGDAVDGILEQDEGGIVPFDLANQDRIIRGRMPVFEMINDTFALEATSSLSKALGCHIEWNPISTDMVRFGEVLRSLRGRPAIIAVMTMAPLKGKLLFIIDWRCANGFLDKLLGGRDAPCITRKCTVLERTLLEARVFPHFLNSLKKAWNIVGDFTPTYEDVIINPQFAHITFPLDIAVCIIFEVEFDDNIGTYFLCYPYTMIGPIREKLCHKCAAGVEELVRLANDRMYNNIKDIKLDLQVKLGSTDMTCDDFGKLKAGDIIPFDQRIHDGMEVFLNSAPRFLCHEVPSDSIYKAISITKTLTNEKFGARIPDLPDVSVEVG
jgi:flagellar motor switch protein FliM